MIARVSLEIALRKEFDYSIPAELAGQVDVGSRVQVPFGARKILGVVTAVAEESAHTQLKPILKVIGAQTLVTEKVLKLARWIGEYYCCAPELALKSVLPEAVRKEDAGWRERLWVRVLPQCAAGVPPAELTANRTLSPEITPKNKSEVFRQDAGSTLKLPKRQQDVWNIVEERREILLAELVELAETTAATVRKLEDRGLIEITSQISERDPYAREQILPSQPLVLNPAQAVALEKIKAAMGQRAAGVPPAEPTANRTLPLEITPQKKSEVFRQDAGSTLSPFLNKAADIQHYYGWLPHWRQADKIYFVTFRLHDSLAQDQLRAWLAEKKIWESHHPKPWDEKVWDEYHDRFTDRMEQWLDNGYGACALRQPEIGILVEKALRHFDGERYQLGDFVVMPNHVHVLVRPAEGHSLESILHSWKSFTAKQANRLLKSSGNFWRDEYFDHLVRSAAQYEKFSEYIRENPVKARLTAGFHVGAGIFNLQRVAGVSPAELAANGTAFPEITSQNKSGVFRQDAGSTFSQRAAGVPPAGPTANTMASSEITSQNKSEVFRQDAGSTFSQRAVGVSPAELAANGTAFPEIMSQNKSGVFRQDAGSTFSQRAAGVSPAGLTANRTASPEITSQNKSGVFRQDAGSTFLLHGVTGSGKTEIYLQAIAHALEQGKGAIVLVPEISLTPQTVERFKARFSSGKLQTLVAVLHSHLSAGERHDEWHKIRQGRARIVIGARSAIFAPVEPLGLIIVDEEHEHTYKQEETPRYHARDVAIMRGQMENAVVVLGSATPSMESFYNCQRGKFALLELRERVDDQKMPLVRVVDMRQAAYKEKGPPIFSPQLKEAITQRLERGEQTILFLNRRGYSSSLQCPKCGFVANCPNCSITLTYHRIDQRLSCHICGHTEKVPSVCPEPKCKNPAIRYAGTGTQKIEEVLAKLFPQARTKRMDADTMKRKDDYRRVLGDFRAGKIDILVGTQMIAKGLHFPNVTLVGVMYADLALHQPDFRAGERTFQLLTQVSGRAGRGDVAGEVFVQAFAPFHPAIQYARRHDFNGFYEQETEFRQQLKYPPFSRIALLTLKGRSEEKVKFSAEHLKRELEKRLRNPLAGGASVPASLFDHPTDGSSGASPHPSKKNLFKDLIIAGPAPAPLLRAETFYRYQIMLRTRAMSALSRELSQLVQALVLPDEVTLAVDIDPVSLS